MQKIQAILQAKKGHHPRKAEVSIGSSWRFEGFFHAQGLDDSFRGQ